MKTANNRNNKSSGELSNASASGSLDRSTRVNTNRDSSIHPENIVNRNDQFRSITFNLSNVLDESVINDFSKLFRAYVPLVRMTDEEINKYTGVHLTHHNIEAIIADGKMFCSYVPLIQLSEEEIKKYTKKTE